MTKDEAIATLRAAAAAVVSRWDSPKWKDEPSTAEVIASLREALAATATTAPSSEPTESMLEAGAAVLYGGSREKARAHVKEDYFESDMHIAGKVYSAMRAEAPATAVLPEGWKIERRTDGRISVVKEGYGGAYVKDDPGFVTAETTLHFLAEDLLAAAPAAPLNTAAPTESQK